VVGGGKVRFPSCISNDWLPLGNQGLSLSVDLQGGALGYGRDAGGDSGVRHSARILVKWPLWGPSALRLGAI